MVQLTIAEAQQRCMERSIPFYAYRLPGEKKFCFGMQTHGRVEEFRQYEKGREGFVLVPFGTDGPERSLFIRGDFVFADATGEDRFREALEKWHTANKPEERVPEKSVSREEYHRQVTRMIAVLKEKTVRKLVLARGLTLAVPGYASAPVWLGKLACRYPDAFVFLVSVPGVTAWMGATPEIFLRQTDAEARTMALAGTRRAGDCLPWGEKEVEEQAIVSEYIGNILGAAAGWQIVGPFSKQAGNVEHLCTTFTFPGQLPAAEVERIRHQLHPTPAVGGFPAREAVEWIKTIEGDKRRYYAGYLGPVKGDGSFHWYVNLRSMELFRDTVRLYAGGGITALSDPVKEWEETELKSRTLLDVIV